MGAAVLRDASTQPGADRWPPTRRAEAAPSLFWQSPTPIAQTISNPTADSSARVNVYVNEGRWVVDCPDCAGAQLAARTDRRFMCNECANVTIQGKWRPVVWPQEESGIEQALASRPPRNAHWRPGETVTDLIAENARNGVA